MHIEEESQWKSLKDNVYSIIYLSVLLLEEQSIYYALAQPEGPPTE